MIKKFFQRRIDKIIEDANIEANKVIAEAKEERLRLISESFLIETIKKEAERIKQKVLDECKEIKEDTKKLQEKILKEDNTIYSIYKYSRVNYLNFDLWAVTDINTHKSGVIDIRGNQIIPCVFDEIGGILQGSNDILVMNIDSNNTYFGLVNKKGNTLIEPKYNDFDCGFIGGLWAVKLNNKWGYVDKNDNTIIPFKYDKANPFFEEKAQVELNGERFYIDKNGVKIE